MIFPLSVFRPRSKITEFTIVPVIREPHLGSNKQNFAIMYNDTAVIDDVFMHNWPTHDGHKLLRSEII